MVHTVNLPASVMPEGLPLYSLDSQLIEDCEEELFKVAELIKKEFNFETETFCLYGPLIPHLNELVKTQAVDLVVMGTHGAGNFLDSLMGTNASAYIKEALCPVLVIPAHTTFSPVRHIAYASDFETEETVYLKQLFLLASGFNAEVNIINIQSEKQLNIVSDSQVFKSIVKHFPHNRYSVAQLRNNDIIAGLQEFVQEDQAEVLAVSIQDRGLLEELFHHSITRKLALRAFVPLLTLPATSYQFQNQRTATKKPAPVA